MKFALENAQKSVKKLSDNVNPRFYPTFHITAEAGWINDPNGLIYHNDLYHVFFQHHPYSAIWGPMHWGHVTSPDLIHWQRQPIALAPTVEGIDKDGCFSGSAVVDNEGKLALIYTGHMWLAGFRNNASVAEVQCLATSEDGIHFEKQGVILEPPEGIMHFRDPKVWKYQDEWYMVIGARPQDNIGEIWLYKSSNLKNWQFEQVLYKASDLDTYMLECPDFFQLGNKWILLCSPQGMKAKDYQFRNTERQAGYIIGNWAPNKSFQVIKEFEECDLGHDFYAPQTFLAADNRRIMLGWANCPNTVMPTQESDNWCCQHTILRELILQNDLSVHAKPIDELKQLRKEHFSLSQFELNDEYISYDLDNNACEIEATLDLKGSNAERFGFEVAVTPNHEKTLIYIDNQTKRLVLERRDSGIGGKGYRTLPLPNQTELKLRIFIDKSLIEIFVENSPYTLTSTIYPTSSQRKMAFFSEYGKGNFLQFDFWIIDNIFK